MRPTHGVRQLVSVVSDGTGRSDQEVWVLAATTAAVAATVAAVRGVIWAVDTVTDVELWPTLPERTRR